MNTDQDPYQKLFRPSAAPKPKYKLFSIKDVLLEKLKFHSEEDGSLFCFVFKEEKRKTSTKERNEDSKFKNKQTKSPLLFTEQFMRWVKSRDKPNLQNVMMAHYCYIASTFQRMIHNILLVLLISFTKNRAGI